MQLRNTFVLVVKLLFIDQAFHDFNVRPDQIDFVPDRRELKARADS